MAHSDVLVQEDALYIAIAGQHQIWRHDMASGTTAVFSGDGYERNANGRNGPGTSWAQPSGISLSAGRQRALGCGQREQLLFAA